MVPTPLRIVLTNHEKVEKLLESKTIIEDGCSAGGVGKKQLVERIEEQHPE